MLVAVADPQGLVVVLQHALCQVKSHMKFAYKG